MAILRRIPMSGSLAAILIMLSACTTTDIETGDTSPPIVQILFQKSNSQYASSPTADLGMDPLKIMAKAIDPQGVRSLRVEFHNSVAHACSAHGAVQQGNYYLSLPGPFEVDPQPAASGKAFTEAGLPISITRPSCSFNGQPGIPGGHVIQAKAIGTNWASDQQVQTTVATADITVIISGWSGPALP